jgi:hypothetical protein
MPIQQRTLGYTPGVQRLVWPRGTDVPVTAYLWGGGGGGGGNDSGPGGSGQGGGATEVSFLVSAGDVIDVTVGGSGGAGVSGRGHASGGTAGASFVSSIIFDTRSATAIDGPVIASTNSAYVGFLNTYGVWVDPVSAQDFDRSYVVNFPFTALYTFTGSADNSAKVFINDAFIGDIAGFGTTYAYTFNVTAGTATVRIVGVNTGGPGSVALTIDSGASYSGSHGGQSGPSGSSGAGGGGGGATVIFKNGIPLAVAAGGGGGGGGGNQGTRTGDSAPGDAGQAALGITSGQNGQNHPSDGGGGGGGGGGLAGGNGGLVRDGDQGGLAGVGGLSSSPASNPSGRIPGGRNNAFYPGNAGTGGTTAASGNAGAAVLLFDVPGLFVHTETSFEPVKDSWVKINNDWVPVEAIFVKDNGSWQPLLGSFSPVFEMTGNNFGQAPRPSVAVESPTFDSGDPGGWSDGISDAASGGGGGGKIICQKLSEMGYFDTEMNRADQLFGVQLQQGDPDAYAGYVRWARPVVVLLEGGGSETLRKLVLFWEKDSQKRKDIQSSIVAYYLDKLARPWAEEMAYRMQAPGHTQSNTAGRFIMNVGLPMCRVIGRWGKDNQWPMWAKTLSIWGTVTVLLVTIATISTVDKLLGKLRKLIGK